VVSEFASNRPRKSNGAFATTSKVYDWLLEFECVRSWIESYQAPLTRKNYLAGLNLVCQRLNVTPDRIVKSARENGDKLPREFKTQLRGLLNSYVQEEKPSRAKRIYQSFRSFLVENEVTVTFTRQERIRYRRKKVIDERVPKRQDIYMLADAAENVKGWRDPLRKPGIRSCRS